MDEAHANARVYLPARRLWQTHAAHDGACHCWAIRGASCGVGGFRDVRPQLARNGICKTKEINDKLNDDYFIAKLTVMTLGLEPTKLVTAFFLNMSEDQRPTCRVNVSDLIRDES